MAIQGCQQLIIAEKIGAPSRRGGDVRELSSENKPLERDDTYLRQGVPDVSDRPDVMLLTGPEAAKALAVSPRTLWGLTKTGTIPCIRIGRAVRYDPADLRAWIESRKSKVAANGAPPDNA